MNDLISRQKLLTELDRYIDAHQGHGFENVRVILRGLKREIIDFPCVQSQQTCEYWDSESKFCTLCRPSAQPHRKTGTWLVDEDGMLHCSRCLENPTNRVMIDGRLVYDMTPIVGKMRYCPNCGVRMEV